ncbi:hypothetical protein ACFCWG_24640 [Streptomyces sp. NPDC056390]|uniref:hypothetical protein n=1 Tax=Streptomyces sp. NPDC056390 TaxID=3345806 RepID=UPI0035DAA411
MTAPLAPRDIAVLTLRQAATHSHSPSDRIAYALDAELLLHPEALAVEVPAGWDHHIAQLVELNHEWEKAAAFNAAHPVGTPVVAYPGVRPEHFPRHPEMATRIESVTRTRATVVGASLGGTAVVWIEDHGAFIALTHIDIRPGGAS